MDFNRHCFVFSVDDEICLGQLQTLCLGAKRAQAAHQKRPHRQHVR